MSFHNKRSKTVDECYLNDLMTNIKGVDIQVVSFKSYQKKPLIKYIFTQKRWFMPKNMTESFLHSKYMVTDQVAYIGTSNWSGDYFSVNTGTSITVKDKTENNLDTVRNQLKIIFERDWNSKYAISLNITQNNVECQNLN